MNWNDLLLRLRALVFRNRVESDLDDELDCHIEMQARKNQTTGMGEAEAMRLARMQFGGAEQIKEECRDARRVRPIESTGQDILYAIRGFRRSPTFVLTVVATIALGLGLNTTLFTIFNAYFFRTVSVHDPHSLYEFLWTDRVGERHSFTWPEYREFLKENPAFSDALAYRSVLTRTDGRDISGYLVNGDYFQMLRVGAELGRTLLPTDSSEPGREPVIVLGYDTWRGQFGSDPNIIGKNLWLRGYPFEVVGVARPGFTGLGETPIDFWAPLTMNSRFDDGPDLFGPQRPRLLNMVGRLKPAINVRQAQAGLIVWAQRFTAERPDAEKAVGAIFWSRATSLVLNPKAALTLSPILVAFTLVLLIACANVANMMLARAMSRQREIGIRLALGAARGRLVRQLLTESILLALPAAAAGFLISQATIGLGVRVLFATLPPEFTQLIRVAPLPPDVRVFGFMLAAALASALLFGLAPAIQATRTSVMQAARGDFTSELRPARLRNSLVIGQITVCVLLLITAGILLRGANRIQSLDIGLRTRDIVAIKIHEKARTRVLDRLSSDPSVEILAGATYVPMNGAFPTVSVAPADGGGVLNTSYNRVSAEYFTVLAIPIVRGRNFTREEVNSGAPVVVISQATAQQLWPNQDALGRSLRVVPGRRMVPSLPRSQVVSVVGIARDVMSGWIGMGVDKALVYFPATERAAGTTLLARVRGDVETARRKLDVDLNAIFPGAVDEINKLQAFVAGNIYPFRVAYWVSSAIGMLALLLTVSGIYGVLSYVVSQRTKEIGIRMAMGATTRAVAGRVLKESMKLGIIGTFFGVVLALGVSRVFATVLAMIDPFDGVACVGGAALALAACGAAAYFPASRAAGIDPITTLRYD
jgi:predicted permease